MRSPGASATEDPTVLSIYSAHHRALRAEMAIAQGIRHNSLFSIVGCIALTVMLLGLTNTSELAPVVLCVALGRRTVFRPTVHSVGKAMEGNRKAFRSLRAWHPSAICVLADKGYDSQQILDHIAAMGAVAVIPSKINRKLQRSHDTLLYRQRNRIERCFSRLKHFRPFATRYEKLKTNFKALVAIACSWLHLQLYVDTA